jgi:hypothetical protein
MEETTLDILGFEGTLLHTVAKTIQARVREGENMKGLVIQLATDLEGSLSEKTLLEFLAVASDQEKMIAQMRENHTKAKFWEACLQDTNDPTADLRFPTN